MNKPSERIVVFVTPAQKRAISATADELGISLSELMRRAVMAFSATSDQVKAASIVDRLNAPRQPDALAQALQKAAKPLRAGRTARPASAATQLDEAGVDEARTAEEETAPSSLAGAFDSDGTDELADETRLSGVARAEREIAQAFARLNAEAEANAHGESGHAPFDADRAVQAAAPPEPLQPLGATGFLRRRRETGTSDGDAHGDDAAPEGGKFA